MSRHGVVAEDSTLFQMVLPKRLKARVQGRAEKKQISASEYFRRAAEDALAADEAAEAAETAPKSRKRSGR